MMCGVIKCKKISTYSGCETYKNSELKSAEKFQLRVDAKHTKIVGKNMSTSLHAKINVYIRLAFRHLLIEFSEVVNSKNNCRACKTPTC